MIIEKLFTPYLVLDIEITPKMMSNFEPFELDDYREVVKFIDEIYSDLSYRGRLNMIDDLLFKKTLNGVQEKFDQWKKDRENPVQKAYLSGLIPDDLIEKAWKKQPVGTVTTRKGGQQYRKVAETGNMDQDWKLVTKDKDESGEPKKEGNSETKQVKGGDKPINSKELEIHAKNASELTLQTAIKESADENVRIAAHNEIDRREKEEKPQEEKEEKPIKKGYEHYL